MSHLGIHIDDLKKLHSMLDIYESYYCIYLFKKHELSGVSRDLLDNFNEYAKRIGKDSFIVQSLDEHTYLASLKSIMKDPWFSCTIGNIDVLPAGFFITRPGLGRFGAKSGHVFIYVSGEVLNHAYQDPIILSQDIVDLCRNDNDTFINRILSYSRGAITNHEVNETILSTLEDSIKIELDIKGVGVELTPVYKLIKDRFDKAEKEHTVYDCVVYQFH